MPSDTATQALSNRAAPERPDVFLSYARRDEAFVRRLAAALDARGKQVWVDWDDIRKSADWRATIEAGLDSSRVVVAVLTPDFAASRVCADEVGHAVAQSKRLVPVVLREPDRTRLRPGLAGPNWLFMRPRDACAGAHDELIEAIDAVL